jgi:small GTP-binding protein
MKESDSSSDSENENPLQESNNSGEIGNDLKDEGKISNQILDGETDKNNQNETSEKKIYDIKIIIVGEIGVGKTSVIRRYLTNNFIEGETASIGNEIPTKSIELDSETKVNLNIIDSAGEEKYGILPNQYFKDCQGAIFMYDLTEKSSFNKINEWLNVLKDKAAKRIVILLAGNKSDLIDKKVNLEDELKPYKEKYDHYEINAKEGNNVDSLFEDLANKIVDILKNKGEHSIIKRRNSVALQHEKKEKEKKHKSAIKEFFSKC